MAKLITTGIQDFKKFREEGMFYVDKTKQMHNLIKSKNAYYFWFFLKSIR
ncbi:MAG: AAA family ATPase [Candidatus Gracilibacteria bacterium]|nr:AAA family ATPase [Candidatus Gracilibacteria bacterium]